MKSLLKHLSTHFAMDSSTLASYINTAPHRYKTYKIAKRKPGQFRTIAQPTKGVKALQRAALPFLKEHFEVHNCATAYVSGKGIKNNAEAHKLNQFLLKLDFKDFFPSIKPIDLLQLAEKAGLEDESEAEIWSRLFFYLPKNQNLLRLSIGAPSSPLISNIVMITFDQKISEHCTENGIQFTRYADDLTFSTNQRNVLFRIPNYIKQELSRLEHPSLSLNEGKTVLSSKKHNRHVTGLVLSNQGKVSIGRERKRIISSMVHKFKNAALNPEDQETLRGLLAFVKDVEPEFLIRLENKYGKEVVFRAFRQGLAGD